MVDVSSQEIMLGTFGTLTVSALLMLVMQTLKDIFPGLSGRKAIVTVYAIAGVVTGALIYQSDQASDIGDAVTTAAAFVVVFISIGFLAQAVYAKVFGRRLSLDGLSLDELNEVAVQVSKRISDERAKLEASESRDNQR